MRTFKLILGIILVIISGCCILEFLPELIKSGATHIILGHLSKENSTPDVALQTCVLELSLAGFKKDKDYRIFAAPRNELSENILL